MEEKLQQLSISKALMIGLGLTMVYFFAIYDDGGNLERQIRSKREETTKAKQELVQIERAIADAERFQKTKETLGQELDLVLKAIPIALSPLDLMRIISNEAKVVGANIINITQRNSYGQNQAKTGEEEPFFEPVSVNVSLEGTYNQLMMFLSNLTKVDKIITVSNLKVLMPTTGNAVEDGAATLLKLEGEFKAYRYLQQDAKDESKGANRG